LDTITELLLDVSVVLDPVKTILVDRISSNIHIFGGYQSQSSNHCTVKGIGIG